jgi:hypothetical protein
MEVVGRSCLDGGKAVTPYQVRLPAYHGAGATLWKACGRSPRRVVLALRLSLRRALRGRVPYAERRQVVSGAPGGLDRRAS